MDNFTEKAGAGMPAALKTPITYYGGKQRMLRHILPLIPANEAYTEVFLGGGAVFWAKERSRVEVINDLNGLIVNFYEVVQGKLGGLLKLLGATLHSREQHEFARIVYWYPQHFDAVRKAWAVWVLSTQSFSSDMNNSWGYARRAQGKTYDPSADKVRSKRDLMSIMEGESLRLAKRLEGVQIENTDALRVLESRDSPSAFHYVDPPYVGADQGHYKGYTRADFERLLNCLQTLDGKWLLSHYRHDLMTEYIERNGWNVVEVEQMLSAGVAKKGAKPRGRKVEVLVRNF